VPGSSFTGEAVSTRSHLRHCEFVRSIATRPSGGKGKFFAAALVSLRPKKSNRPRSRYGFCPPVPKLYFGPVHSAPITLLGSTCDALRTKIRRKWLRDDAAADVCLAPRPARPRVTRRSTSKSCILRLRVAARGSAVLSAAFHIGYADRYMFGLNASQLVENTTSQPRQIDTLSPRLSASISVLVSAACSI
jgi:hypothetical protein